MKSIFHAVLISAFFVNFGVQAMGDKEQKEQKEFKNWHCVKQEELKTTQAHAVVSAELDRSLPAPLQAIVMDYVYPKAIVQYKGSLEFDDYPASKTLLPRAVTFFDGARYKIAMNQLRSTIKIFDVSTKKCERTLEHRTQAYMNIPSCFASCMVDDKSKIAASLDANQNIKVFDAASGRLENTIPGSRGAQRMCIFNDVDHNMPKVAATIDKTVKIFDIKTGACEKTITLANDSRLMDVEDVLCVPVNRKIITAIDYGIGNNICIWDMNSGKLDSELPSYYDSLTTFKDIDGTIKIAAANEYRVDIINLTGQREKTLQPHASPPLERLVVPTNWSGASPVSIGSYSDKNGQPHLVVLTIFNDPTNTHLSAYTIRHFDLANKIYSDTPFIEGDPYCGINIGSHGSTSPVIAIPTIGNKLHIWECSDMRSDVPIDMAIIKEKGKSSCIIQ